MLWSYKCVPEKYLGSTCLSSSPSFLSLYPRDRQLQTEIFRVVHGIDFYSRCMANSMQCCQIPTPLPNHQLEKAAELSWELTHMSAEHLFSAQTPGRCVADVPGGLGIHQTLGSCVSGCNITAALCEAPVPLLVTVPVTAQEQPVSRPSQLPSVPMG